MTCKKNHMTSIYINTYYIIKKNGYSNDLYGKIYIFFVMLKFMFVQIKSLSIIGHYKNNIFLIQRHYLYTVFQAWKCLNCNLSIVLPECKVTI